MSFRVNVVKKLIISRVSKWVVSKFAVIAEALSKTVSVADIRINFTLLFQSSNMNTFIDQETEKEFPGQDPDDDDDEIIVVKNVPFRGDTEFDGHLYLDNDLSDQDPEDDQ